MAVNRLEKKKILKQYVRADPGRGSGGGKGRGASYFVSGNGYCYESIPPIERASRGENANSFVPKFVGFLFFVFVPPNYKRAAIAQRKRVVLFL